MQRTIKTSVFFDHHFLSRQLIVFEAFVDELIDLFELGKIEYFI